MKTPILLAATALALIAVPVARPSGLAFTSCGMVSGGGARWRVVATQVPCRTAKSLVKQLAAKPHPTLPTRLGTHHGLKCVEYAKGRTREIACVSRDATHTVYGVTPPHK